MNSSLLEIEPDNGHVLTTADLVRIQADLESVLAERGLRLSPVAVTVPRAADMHFIAPDAPLDKTVEMIAASDTVLVIPHYQEFDPAELAGEGSSPTLEQHRSVAKVLAVAGQYDGQLCRIALYWSMDGILCCWLGSASWLDQLQRDYDAATLAAADEEATNDEAQQETTAGEIRRTVAELMENPAYRSAARNKRAAVARNLISDPNSEVGFYALRALSRSDTDEAARLTLEIRSRFDEIALSLGKDRRWVMACTSAERKQAAQSYLSEVADGWCMPATLATELRDRALEIIRKSGGHQS